MTIDDFLLNISEIFEDTSKDSLTGSTKFKELDEWDSMTSLSLIAIIDEKYKVVMTDKEIEASDIFMDIFNIINEKGNG